MSVPARGRQRYAAKHQSRACHLNSAGLLFAVYYIQLLCVAWVWLGGGTKEAVCSPSTSMLLFAPALWCIERSVRSRISLTDQHGRNPTLLVLSLTIPSLSATTAFIHFNGFTLDHWASCPLLQRYGEGGICVCVSDCMHAKREWMDMLEIAVQCNRNKWLHAKCAHVCLVSKLNYRPSNNIHFAPVP